MASEDLIKSIGESGTSFLYFAAITAVATLSLAFGERILYAAIGKRRFEECLRTGVRPSRGLLWMLPFGPVLWADEDALRVVGKLTNITIPYDSLTKIEGADASWSLHWPHGRYDVAYDDPALPRALDALEHRLPWFHRTSKTSVRYQVPR